MDEMTFVIEKCLDDEPQQWYHVASFGVDCNAYLAASEFADITNFKGSRFRRRVITLNINTMIDIYNIAFEK